MTTKTYLERAIEDGHAKFSGEGRTQKIIYLAVNHSERYADPEEQVRAEFWAELIYRYGYEPQYLGLEVIVPDRTPHDRADIVVFRDNERKRPYAVVECKKDGITDAEFNQAVEQAFGNGQAHRFRAEFIGVVAGQTRGFFDCSDQYGVLERSENIIADLPLQYGKPEEFKYHKGGSLDIREVNKEELISAIKKCHQTIWNGGKRKPDQAFGELCKIIFVKISDEIKARRIGEPYEFQTKTHEPRHRLAGRIKALYQAQQNIDPEVFSDPIKLDDAELATVVAHLQGLNLNKTDLDTKGVAFEKFNHDYFKGDAGQYFTPREIVDFSIGMLKKQGEKWHDKYVLDPSCGSGGFLLYALDAVRNEADEYWNKETEKTDHKTHWHDFAAKRLYGIEINEEIARVAKMNMIIHDDGHTNVIGKDALDRFARLQETNRGFAKERFDIILTNPPFGAQVNSSQHPYLSEYDLGNQEDARGKKKPRKNQKTEILFLERIHQFLKPGIGRASVVLPDGILTNSSLQYVRDWLLQHFQLMAVVSLPQTAFSHYGAGVKASVVFLRKRAENEIPDDGEAIFMAVPEKIGYDAAGRKCENQLAEVVTQFRKFERNPKPFFV